MRRVEIALTSTCPQADVFILGQDKATKRRGLRLSDRPSTPTCRPSTVATGRSTYANARARLVAQRPVQKNQNQETYVKSGLPKSLCAKR